MHNAMAKSSVDRWIDLVCNRWNINRIDSIGQFSRTVFQIEVLRIEYKRQISLLHQVSQLFEHWQTYCFRSNGSKNSNFLFDIEINWPNSTIVHDPIGVIWFHHQSLRAFKLMIQLQMYTNKTNFQMPTCFSFNWTNWNNCLNECGDKIYSIFSC